MTNNIKPSFLLFTKLSTLIEKGVALVEVIVVICLMAILMTIGVPNFQTIIVSNRLTLQANTMLSALSFARSEAIKRNRLVVFTKTAADWAEGWTIFVDINANKSLDVDQEPELQRYEAIWSGYSINRVGFSNAGVIYRPDGRTTTIGHFDICSPVSNADFREIIIADTGRVRIDRPGSSGKTYEGVNCP